MLCPSMLTQRVPGSMTAPAQYGTNAGEQFHQGKLLCDVVITTGPKALKLLGIRAFGGQDDNRCIDMFPLHLLQYMQIVNQRQHHIEDDQMG